MIFGENVEMLDTYIDIADGLRATTYGYYERSCGSAKRPAPCTKGQVTASGEVFDPDVASAAIFSPHNMRLRARDIWLKVYGGPCVKIRLNDKGNERFIGQRGFDLTKKAVFLLTGSEGHEAWSSIVYVCNKKA